MMTRPIICVTALLLAFSFVGCASSPEQQILTGEKAKPSIYQVTKDLRARLDKDDRLQGSKIDFDFDGATVILNGKVKDTEQFGWAATVAAGTPGVTSVINRLQIEPEKREQPEAQKPKPVPLHKQVPKETAQPQTPAEQTS